MKFMMTIYEGRYEVYNVTADRGNQFVGEVWRVPKSGRAAWATDAEPHARYPSRIAAARSLVRVAREKEGRP